MHIFTPYKTYFDIGLIVICFALVASILMQARGAGLGSVFGGTGTVFKTRRGIEQLLYRATAVLAVFFALGSFFVWMIP